MIKQIGRIRINKRFLRLLDFKSKKLLKEKLWSKIKIMTVDYDEYDVFVFYAESKELFYKIILGRMKVPEYTIVLHTNPDGTLDDISIEIKKETIESDMNTSK